MPADATTTPTAQHLAVDIRQFLWIRRLAADYAFDYAKVDAFYAGNPATGCLGGRHRPIAGHGAQARRPGTGPGGAASPA
ncbi:MAG: hypothetical protein R2712_06860 [Vicinamibacterales bacterium]